MELRSALANMLNSNNHVRQEAESYYNTLISTSPSSTIESLLFNYHSSPIEIKLLICLILKQLFDPLSSKEIWSKLDENSKSSIKTSILSILSSEKEPKPSDLLCEVVGKLASNIFANKIDWPELINFIQNSLQSANPVAFDLLSFTFVHVYKAFDLTPHQIQGFLTSNSNMVKLKVLKLINAILAVYQKVKALPFMSLVPQILQAVYLVLNADEPSGAQALEVLREIIENRGFLFSDFLEVLDEFQSSCLKLQISDATRFLVTDCLVTLYESTSDLPTSLSQKILESIFSLMIQSESSLNDFSEQVEIDYPVLGRKQINRLIESSNEDVLLPSALSLIHSSLTSSDWRMQYCGILTLGELIPFIAEPSKISELIPIVTSSCSSSICKLRFAGFYLITDLSLSYVQDFQASYHKEIFPILFNGCQDPVIQVKLQALNATTGFIEGSGYKISSTYIEKLPYFVSLFYSQNIEIIENAVKTISAFGKTSKTSLFPYYQDLVAELLKLLNMIPKHQLACKSRVIECISLCSAAVGKQLFVTRIKDIIEAFATFEVVPSDESLIYVLNAWENICDLLQEDFCEYLDCIVPFLIRFLASPNEGVNVNTSEVINKEQALQTLNKFVSVLQGRYFKYLDDTLRVALPLVNYTLNDNLRSTSAEILANLVQAKKQSADPNAFSHSIDLAKVFLDLLFHAIQEEFNKEILQSQLEAVSQILTAVGSSFLPQEKISELSSFLLPIFLKKSSKYSGGDDKFLIFAFADVIGSVFKSHSMHSNLLLSQLSSEVFPKLLNSKEKVLQRAVLFIIDDAIEHLGATYPVGKWDEVLSILLCYAADPDDETRQAAVYGLGIFAMVCPNVGDKSHVVLNALWDSLNVDSKRIKTKALAKDNSVSAIGRVLKFQYANIDFNANIEKWIWLLPVKWDKVEAVFVHEFLGELLLKHLQSVVNGEVKRFVKVVKVVAEVFGTKFVNDRTNGMFREFLIRNSQDLEMVKEDIQDVLEKVKDIIRNE